MRAAWIPALVPGDRQKGTDTAAGEGVGRRKPEGPYVLILKVQYVWWRVTCW